MFSVEAELQTKLGFRRFKHPKPGAVPTIFNSDPTQSAMFNKREKKGSRSAQKRRQYLLHQIVGRQFLFKGYNKMAEKGREIKVHFTFVMDKFASAKPLNLLIIYYIPSTSESYNSSFWLFV